MAIGSLHFGRSVEVAVWVADLHLSFTVIITVVGVAHSRYQMCQLRLCYWRLFIREAIAFGVAVPWWQKLIPHLKGRQSTA